MRFIDLTKVEPFQLVELRILPSTCEASWPGRRKILQPRVMQVLVALNAGRGAVLSHGDLILACWEGRVVGEDAIQRCIAKLRHLGAESGAFKIVTVPRIGYRLDLARSLSPALPITRRFTARNAALGTAAVLATCALAAALLLRHAGESKSYDVVAVDELAPVGGDLARALTISLRGDLIDVLRESRVEIPGDASRAGVVLDGSVAQTAQQLGVYLQLTDAKSGTVLWSKDFEGSGSNSEQLATRASVALAQNLRAIRDTRLQPGYDPDPQIVALHVRGSELVRSPQLLEEGAPSDIYQTVVAQAPGFALGHAMLALAYVNEARKGMLGNRKELQSKAQMEATKAISINPASAGAAYDALYLISRMNSPRDLVRQQKVLSDGLRNAPAFAYLPMRQCRLLTDVGQANEGLTYCQRAMALAPFAEPIAHSYALALDTSGKVSEATEVIEGAARNNPEHEVTRLMRIEFAMFGDHPNAAVALLEDPATRPETLSASALSAVRRYLQHSGPWIGGERDGLATQIVQNAYDDPKFTSVAVLMLASMGSNDKSFEVLHGPNLDQFLLLRGGGFLFEPAARPLREDARFWPLAAGLGLASYWTSTGKWPDMCGHETALLTCKARAAEALRR